MSLQCPQCSAEWRCPCSAPHCTNLRKSGDPEWEYDGNLQVCKTCGFAEDVGWFLDLEFWMMDPVQYCYPVTDALGVAMQTRQVHCGASL